MIVDLNRSIKESQMSRAFQTGLLFVMCMCWVNYYYHKDILWVFISNIFLILFWTYRFVGKIVEHICLHKPVKFLVGFSILTLIFASYYVVTGRVICLVMALISFSFQLLVQKLNERRV